TNADLDAARFAEAVLVLVDHVDCFLDLLEQLALAITGAQFQCELFFLGGAVVRVRQVGGLVLQMVDGAIRLLHQLLAPGQQDLAEVLALRFVHVLFALGGHVRCEAMHGGARLRCRNIVELSFHFRWYLYRGFDCFPRTGRRRLHRRCRALRRQCLGHVLLADAVLLRLFGRRLGGSFLYCRLSGGRRFLCCRFGSDRLAGRCFFNGCLGNGLAGRLFGGGRLAGRFGSRLLRNGFLYRALRGGFFGGCLAGSCRLRRGLFRRGFFGRCLAGWRFLYGRLFRGGFLRRRSLGGGLLGGRLGSGFFRGSFLGCCFFHRLARCLGGGRLLRGYGLAGGFFCGCFLLLSSSHSEQLP